MQQMTTVQFISYVKDLIDVVDGLTVGVCWAFMLGMAVKIVKRALYDVYFS